jgi:hypothetical protein
MSKRRIPHSLSLTEEEEAQFIEVNKLTGAGVKKLFMTMIKSVLSSSVEKSVEAIPQDVIPEEE